MESTQEWSIGKHQAFDPLLACLQAVAEIHNKPCSAVSITSGLPLEDNRLSLDCFERAANRAGFSAKITPQALAKIDANLFPVILILKNKKSCVLTRRLEGDTVEIIRVESGTGTTIISLEKLAEEYFGHCIYIKPNYQFDTRTEEPEDTKKKHWFWGVVTREWPIYSEVLVASFLINLFAVAVPLFVMNVYDRVVPNQAISTLWVLAIGMLIVIVFEFLMRTLRAHFIDEASKKIDMRLSATTFEQVLGLRMAERPKSVGAMSNTIQSFATFREFITSATVTVLVDIPFVLLFVAVIFMLHPGLSLVPITIIPLILLLTIVMQVPMGKLVNEKYRHAAEKQALLVETLAGNETIKALRAESLRQGQWEKINDADSTVGIKLRALINFASHFATSMQYIATIAIVIVGVYLIGLGEMTVGALIAATILTGRALAPVVQIASLIARYKQSKASLVALDKVMQLETERPEGRHFLQRPDLKGSIRFKEVTFNYPGETIAALDKVSFSIKAGERVGIIGRAGSGKSSIVKLISGMYEAKTGSILIDGTDIHQLDPAELREQIGYVPQEVILFHGSLRENLLLASPHVSDEVMLRAACITGVDTLANQHPDGFDRQVGERGCLLSGGQRQAVALARSLLLNPQILLFDEPTNCFDEASTKQFIARFMKQYRNQTLVLITHKPSMFTLVDRLIVIDQGKIIADGPKEKVLEHFRKKSQANIKTESRKPVQQHKTTIQQQPSADK